ncbi:MAG: aminopeptidase P family protein [Clostridium sp.]|uniref:aminopeptidase P family protein n=1 Tax=Clostridium sp. TaxID=1506 RepID=UPI002FC9B799
MNVIEKIEGLRSSMKENGINAYIIPSFDSHQSEYVSEYFKARAWISGFTGSAGTVVVTLDRAILWTDGRYYIQAERQIEGTGIELYKMGQINVPTYIEFLKEELNNGDVVGFDGAVLPVNTLKLMEEAFKTKCININSEKDLILPLWSDRPEMPKSKVFLYDIKFAGKSAIEKIDLVRTKMKETGSSYYILSSLDDIAWTLNIRGSDVSNNPVTISYLLIGMDYSELFIDSIKVTPEIISSLEQVSVKVNDYNKVFDRLKELKNSSIIFDPNKTNVKILNSIDKTMNKVEKRNLTTDLKAIKNDVEIANFRNCTIRDGVAMVKFIKYIKENIGKETITETSATEVLTKLRQEQEYFVEPSFTTIAGYKDHAAMMHYSASPETEYTLKPEGLFLVDSGGQYYDGTTDITRTIVLGKLSAEEKKDFTLVLKGNLDLTMLKFLYGATGSNLDIVARMPLWNEGIDYKCGTGHGVGFFLNIHEGPQGFSQVPSNIRLEAGMNLTNEPGIYKEGKHGIRIENLLFVVKDELTEYGGQFMKFEVATFCPIDLEGIVVEMLSAEERNFLNQYHKEVYILLSPYLNENERIFLKHETRAI